MLKKSLSALLVETKARLYVSAYARNRYPTEFDVQLPVAGRACTSEPSVAADSADGTEKSGSVAESCRGAHMSGGLSHCRPLIIVDNVPPESIRAAAHDIACRASKVNILAVGTFAIN